uniref:GA-binding protein subunit beta-2 n=1 Tax=Cacopsylla melanoneura TaxID=428564 RepID=A0A8D8WQM1_9HEMI
MAFSKDVAFLKTVFQVCTEGDVESVRKCLESFKASKLPTDLVGSSPIHYAAKRNKLDVAKLLLESKKCSLENKMQKTPLHLAAKEGHVTMCELLIQHKVDVNHRDIMGMTALHWAVTYEHYPVVSLLLDNGGDPNISDWFGRSPLLIADVNVSVLSQLNQRNETKTQQQQPAAQKRKSEPETSKDFSKKRRRMSQDNLRRLHFLKQHGISHLPEDNTTTVATALKNGQTAVLTEAGQQLLKLFKSYDAQPDRDLQRLSKMMWMSQNNNPNETESTEPKFDENQDAKFDDDQRVDAKFDDNQRIDAKFDDNQGVDPKLADNQRMQDVVVANGKRSHPRRPNQCNINQTGQKNTSNSSQESHLGTPSQYCSSQGSSQTPYCSQSIGQSPYSNQTNFDNLFPNTSHVEVPDSDDNMNTNESLAEILDPLLLEELLQPREVSIERYSENLEHVNSIPSEQSTLFSRLKPTTSSSHDRNYSPSQQTDFIPMETGFTLEDNLKSLLGVESMNNSSLPSSERMEVGNIADDNLQLDSSLPSSDRMEVGNVAENSLFDSAFDLDNFSPMEVTDVCETSIQSSGDDLGFSLPLESHSSDLLNPSNTLTHSKTLTHNNTTHRDTLIYLLRVMLFIRHVLSI